MDLNCFIPRLDKDVHDFKMNKPTEFHYQSIHIVVCPKKDDSEFDNEIINFLSCEIQIRTLLQHAFAEIAHNTTFKGPFKNDPAIKRDLSKSSALMEVTDDYFCEIYKKMANPELKSRNYLRELTRIYQKFRPDFSGDKIDMAYTDNVFKMLALEPVEITSLEEFIVKKHDDFKAAIEANQDFIFNQPTVLLLGYYLYKKPGFIRNPESWPLSNLALETLHHGFGVSTYYT